MWQILIPKNDKTKQNKTTKDLVRVSSEGFPQIHAVFIAFAETKQIIRPRSLLHTHTNKQTKINKIKIENRLILFYLDKRRQCFPADTELHLTLQHFPYLNRVFKKVYISPHKQNSSHSTGLIDWFGYWLNRRLLLTMFVPVGRFKHVYFFSLAKNKQDQRDSAACRPGPYLALNKP